MLIYDIEEVVLSCWNMDDQIKTLLKALDQISIDQASNILLGTYEIQKLKMEEMDLLLKKKEQPDDTTEIHDHFNLFEKTMSEFMNGDIDHQILKQELTQWLEKFENQYRFLFDKATKQPIKTLNIKP